MSAAVRLDIVAESQDRASAMLRTVRKELASTEEQLRRNSAASKEDADVSDIFARAQSRKIRDQVAANEAAAASRREAILLAREQRAAAQSTSGLANAQKGLAGAFGLADKATQTFGKVMGVAGFLGVVGGAVAGVATLAAELMDLESATTKVTTANQAMAASLAELTELAFGLKLARSSDDEQARLKAAREQADLAVKQLLNQGLQAAAHANMVKADEEILALRERINSAITVHSQNKIPAWEREINELLHQRRIASDAYNNAKRNEIELQARLNVLNMEASPLYAIAAQGAEGIASALASAVANAQTLGGALSGIGAKALEGSGKGAGVKPPKPTGGGGGEAAARQARVAGLQDEIAALRIRASAESDYERDSRLWLLEQDRIERDFAAKKINEQERSLALLKLGLEWEIKASEAIGRAKEEEANAARKAAEEGLAAQAKANEERSKRQEEDRLAGIEREAAFITSIGDAARSSSRALDGLAEGLGRVGDAISDASGLWAEYAKGSKALGDTVAGTFSVMGGGIAAAIKDKRVAAGVEGAFEAAASIASFASGNIPAGIGHAAASAAFFAVAGGAGGGGGGKTNGASKGTPTKPVGSFGESSGSSRPKDERSVVIVQYGSGIVYGMGSEVAKAASQADTSLRGTGMRRRRF